MTASRHTRGVCAVAALLVLTGCSPSTGGPVAPDQPIAVDQRLRALLPDDVRDAGVLTVATDASYPPASSFGPDGRSIVGFEPDLAAALGDLLGVRVEFRLWDFDTMLADLGAGDFDLVISAMTDTTDREAQADFVNYFRAGTSVVVQRGNPHGIMDLTDLCGRLVAVEAATVQVDLVQRSQDRCGDDPIQLAAFGTNDDALVELRTGRAAAVLNDYPPAVYVTTDERTGTAFQLVSDVQYEPGLYGIGVARERTELRDAIAAALAVLLESGVYQQVLDEWDVGSGAVNQVTVNGGDPATA